MISLVTFFYNGYDRYLKAWVNHLLLCEELPDEVILLASGDHDEKNVKMASERLSEKLPCKVVHISKHKSMGQARNDGVRAASSPWVMLLMVDDMIMPNAFRDIRKYLSDDIDVLSGAMIWSGYSRHSGVRYFHNKPLMNDHSVFRKSIWEKSPHIEYSGDVHTAWSIGLRQVGARFKCINEIITLHEFKSDTVYGKYTKKDKAEIKRMKAIWLKEGVHSERFNTKEYKPRGDYGFKHNTHA